MQSVSIEGFQLSPQQKRLWQLQQAGDRQTYRIQFILEITGDISLSLLELSIQKVMDRNEILRTNFPILKGMSVPLQVITENRHFKINQSQPTIFDLENGDILNISLVQSSPNKSILIITASAICADIISLHNLVQEILTAYTARDLTDEPLQYADIAAWQNELLLGEAAETGKDYWCKQNIYQLITGKLPSEQSLPNSSAFNPQVIDIKLDHDCTETLIALAQQNAKKIETLLISSWQILLSRFTGETEIAIASYFDGRNYPELKPALGLLAKYIPVSCTVNENATFLQIWQQIETKISEIEQWQETFSWEDINSPEIYLPFAFEFNSQPHQYSSDNITFTIQKQYACLERFKVKLSCWLRDDSLIAELHYDANLFSQADIERLAQQWQTLLTNAIENPQTNSAKLEILSHQERQQLLFEFNQTQADLSPYQCIHHWFAAQVQSTPNNIAVVFEDEQLTYQQLDTKANAVAQKLVSLGVKPETIVGLYVERSLELAIGILGILKAGGAYLPLDPSLPSAALVWRLQDAQASVLLTQKHLVPVIVQNQVQVVCLDADIQLSNVQLHPVVGENLAYVIYTSGSTGEPKGVAVEHRHLLNYLNGILAKLNLSTPANFATVSTFAADLGNTAIFAALCTGGCLHIISSERATNPQALADYCSRYQIDCLKIVPSHLSALLASESAPQILPRQRLILGGEACNWQLIELVRQYAPNCQIFNHYGPTETTVGVLTYAVTGDAKSSKVPLGHPLANTQIYLLDKYQQPVPIGVVGEIYIGGDSVARGYLNQPEMTAERFIQDHFHQTPAARLYKTGDLAKYLPDGNLEFVGRVDDQVKLHGFRVELGEITAALHQHPDVREVVVVLREDEPGQKRLVAYIVTHQQITIDGHELRSFLKQKLPEYMLPAHFVQLKALPLTVNGKLDRKALPKLDSIQPKLQTNFVPPHTQIEKILAEIWTQLLGVEQVSIHDNFFELGGDSIISIQVIARANNKGLRLTTKQIFEYQTIAQLATIVETVSVIESEQGLVSGAVPLTPIQISFFAQNLLRPHHWNQSLLLELRQQINLKLLDEVVQQLLKQHDALRLRFWQETDGWHSAYTDIDQESPCDWIDISHLSADKQTATIETIAAQVQASLNISSGKLLRVVLFDLGNDLPSRLLIVIHHLAVDGISWRILLSDFQTALEQISRGEVVHLPPKTTSFQQWAKRLQEYGQTKTLHTELNYWCSEARKKVVPLAVDDSGENTIAKSQTISVSLSASETQILLQEVPIAYHTQVNDILLTALTLAFTQWTGKRSLLLNLEGHGREEIFPDLDVSRTVGWFTTVFPVLLDLKDTNSIGDALKSIKEQLRQIPHRGINYGVLRYLSLDSTVTQAIAAMPAAQVCFNYLGQFDPSLESSIFQLATEASGATRSPLNQRRHLLDINGFVTGKKLQFHWTYSAVIHHQTTITNLATEFIQTLRQLITHCQSMPRSYTPSDFPKANLSQKDLDRLLAKIQQS